MEKNERLSSKELLSRNFLSEELEHANLTREDAEEVFSERAQMLDSIKGVLSKSLREALSIKISREKKALLEMIEEDETLQETQQRRSRVLDYTYFKKKPLNLKRM
jgi:hypothetical protein